MKTFVCAAFVSLLCIGLSMAKNSPPKVQVYSRMPGEFGKPNTIICHVSGFYPPDIKIEILGNDEVLPAARQTDLEFDEQWHYHLTRHAPFTPAKDVKYTCRVTHSGDKNTYIWEPDM